MPTRRSFLLGGIGSLVVAACSDDGTSASSSTTTPFERDDPVIEAPDESTTTTTAGASDPSDEPSPPLEPSDPTTLTPADFTDVGACLLLPEEIEGPYYLDEALNRRDITDGAAGLPMRIGLMVVDQSCLPIEGAAVDVWHADAGGAYSGFNGAAGTSMRGTQVADRNGIVEFGSIYPGWYRGRTVHVHVKVHIDDSVVLTTQLVFDDATSDEVYAASPYAERGARDTRNDTDTVIPEDWQENGTRFLVLADGPDGSDDGLLALAVLGVDPSGAGGSVRPLL